MADFEEIRDGNLRLPKKANTYRILPRKDKILIEFGRIPKGAKRVNVLSSIWIEPQALESFIMSAFDAGIAFQKKTGEDIGFGDLIKEEERESVINEDK